MISYIWVMILIKGTIINGNTKDTIHEAMENNGINKYV